ncbi:MAG TPA: hypothetical protein VF995_06670, partial [Actinomycetota bacterium]
MGVAGLVVAALLLGLQFVRLGRNHLGSGPTAPFVVGTSWQLDEELAARHIRVALTPGNGYDGQWFLGLGYDPLLRHGLANGFDMPRYRARRPLLPLVGWVLGVGQPVAVPVALLAVEVLAVALGCAAAARILGASGWSRWWGVGFAVIPGVAVGVMFGTAEPLGLALATLGLCLVLEGRIAAAAAAFAAAGLTKETYLGFAAAAAVWLLLRPGDVRTRVRTALTVATPGVAALALWWWYVAWTVPASGSDTAGDQAFSLPLVGWAHTLARIASGRYVPDAPVGPAGPALLIGTFVLLLAAVAAGPRLLRGRRRPDGEATVEATSEGAGTGTGARGWTLAAWTGLLMGCYGLALAGTLLDRFLSASRALAPAVLAAGLSLAASLAASPSHHPPEPGPGPGPGQAASVHP